MSNGEEPEVWKVIPECPTYEVSNLGRVKCTRGIVTPSISNKGYLRFRGEAKGKGFNFHLHRVVCKLFHGEPPEDKPFALHKNHIKVDCRESNLYWGSHQDNMNDRNNAGRYTKHVSQETIDSIRQRWATGETQSSIARSLSLSQVYIGKVVRNKTRRIVESADA